MRCQIKNLYQLIKELGSNHDFSSHLSQAQTQPNRAYSPPAHPPSQPQQKTERKDEQGEKEKEEENK